MELETREVDVDRGVTLRHLAAGQGSPVVMLGGWSQTAEMFRPQVEGLAESYSVIALDHRGHGRSDRPDDGYRIHRLAADLHEVLDELDLDDVTLLGHSMGVAVIYAYLDIYRRDRVRALVLVDQMPCALANPAWSDTARREAGATIDTAGLFEFTGGLRGAAGEEVRSGFLDSVTSSGIPAADLAFIKSQNATFPLEYAADLLHDTAVRDWRPFLPTIDLPTLVVSGNSVNVPIESQRWVHAQIVGSTFAVVEGVSGGTHFPFVERPEEFTGVVADFLDARR